MPLQDGFLLINKPSGPTSYDMIRWIKRKSKGVKIGHAGTLDPLATGLLVVLLGKATKRQSDVMGRDKTYRCRLRFGVKTDSGDITGAVLETSTNLPTEEQAFRATSRFLGQMNQIPPMYSALKKDGVPLYKLARAGKTVERKSRSITLQWIEPVAMNGSDFEFRVKCSSGTYIRTLVEDIGVAAGCGATMTGLVRESIGSLRIEDAIPGDELRELDEAGIDTRVMALATEFH